MSACSCRSSMRFCRASLATATAPQCSRATAWSVPCWQRWDRWPRLCRRSSRLGSTYLRRLRCSCMFVLYGVLGSARRVCLSRLAGRARNGRSPADRTPREIQEEGLSCSRRLFSLDAFGGGFVVQSMIALWLYQRFDLSLATAGTVFFWTGMLIGAVLSGRCSHRPTNRPGQYDGLHAPCLPACVCSRFRSCPTLGYVIALLLIRSALSQMDVPTRSSYVMAIVSPAERPAAAVSLRCREASRRRSVRCCRLPARPFGVRMAAGDRRRDEDRLRPLAAGNVSPRATA